MQIETITARKTVDNAFLQETITEAEFETFRQRLLKLLNQADEAVEGGESEEHLKNLIKPFFSNTNFEEDYYINTKERQDLAIHNDKSRKSSVGVMIEAKRPSNTAGMITGDDLNRKAFHETILYYLRERIDNDNEDIKHIIITDVYHWYLFDAQDFERHFYESKKLQNWYEEWKQGQKVSSRTKFVYDHLQELVDELDGYIKTAHVDISSYRKLLEKEELSRDEQKKLVPLFKLFTPTHLLKQPFASDSNELNKAFYRELLYIMGLKEYKEKGTHYITRLDEENRQHASLIENTITQLESMSVLSRLPNRSEFGEDEQEQLFNVAIQLLITWINRILFLKLLEAQLYKYHREDDRFRFLSHEEIEEYDDLNKLFFQVLAVPYEDRSDRINKHFGHIPYLNSSLFDVSEIEADTLAISTLEDGLQIPVYKSSKITDRDGQPLKGEKLSALEYLLRFLDAYNFNTEGTAEVQKEAKTLINASVLGRIFEKINGYKDGSFFTPGYITEYMCRETIRRGVVEKFAEALTPGPSPARRRGEQPSSNADSNSHPSTAGGGRTEDGGGSYSAGWKLPESLIESARHLRKEQTEPEELLWQLLRNKQLDGFKFRRQHPIKPGFVLDFYCAKENLAIEIDGGYHNDDAQQVADEERTKILKQKGIEVIRFTNEQVLKETESVLEEIYKALDGPHPESLSRGERDIGRGNLSFADIHNAIGRDISIEEANEIINSITICDPAVGSGHFLVSALNELIAIKSDLGILYYIDDNGNYRRFRDVDISVDNDELSIAWGTDPFFEYRVTSEWKESGHIERSVGTDTQRLQKALFREKNVLIENCLFGVDINPNSVNICRLRLWIELLKHAYYKESPFEGGAGQSGSEDGRGMSSTSGEHPSRINADSPQGENSFQHLEVLPNIDINIKQGNSLVSRFDLDADLSQILANNDDLTIEEYKQAVQSYKETGDREDKRALKEQINSIKESFSVGLKELHPVRQKLKKQRELLIKKEAKLDLFEGEKKSKKEQKKIKKTKKKIGKLEEELEELENATFYDEAFEWRFEFPEVLDEQGNFTGFDAVIGNPPYIRQEELKVLKEYLKENYEVYYGTADLYQYFVEQGISLLQNEGFFHYIVSNKWLRTNYGQPLREFLSNHQLKSLIDFGDLPVFQEASAYPCLLQITKAEVTESFKALEIDSLEFEDLATLIAENSFRVDQTKLLDEGWTLVGEEAQKLIEKLRSKGTRVEDYANGNIYRGIITGLNDAFLIDKETKDRLIEEDRKSAKLIKPFLVGSEIKRYRKPINESFVILIPDGFTENNATSKNRWSWFKDEYPAIAKHLENFEERAEKRYDQGEYWWELRACSYYDEFAKDKIVFPNICSRPEFTFDTDSKITNQKCYIISLNDNFLLGVLNSKPTHFLFEVILPKLRGDFYEPSYVYFKEFPIPIVDSSDISKKKKIESLVEQILNAKEEDSEADTSKLEEKIDQLVYELYELSEEEIGIVEESVGK